MIRRAVFCAVVLCLVSCIASHAARAGRDHPLFPRAPGYEIASYAEGPQRMPLMLQGEKRTLSGKGMDVLYRAVERPLPPSALYDRFIDMAVREGGEILFRENPALGGYRAAAKFVRPGWDVWVIQDVPSPGKYRVTALEIPNGFMPLPGPPAVSGDFYETEAQVLDLLYELERTGRLDLPIRFASGAGLPKGAYRSQLEKIVMLMEKDPRLLFRVGAYVDPDVEQADRRGQLRERAKLLLGLLAGMGADMKRLAPDTAESAGSVPVGFLRLTSAASLDTVE